jgi:hypothetical protein
LLFSFSGLAWVRKGARALTPTAQRNTVAKAAKAVRAAAAESAAALWPSSNPKGPSTGTGRTCLYFHFFKNEVAAGEKKF